MGFARLRSRSCLSAECRPYTRAMLGGGWCVALGREKYANVQGTSDVFFSPNYTAVVEWISRTRYYSSTDYAILSCNKQVLCNTTVRVLTPFVTPACCKSINSFTRICAQQDLQPTAVSASACQVQTTCRRCVDYNINICTYYCQQVVTVCEVRPVVQLYGRAVLVSHAVCRPVVGLIFDRFRYVF